jgi:hypothetical protein
LRHDSVLKNIEISLVSLVQVFNGKMPTSLVKATRKAFEACFVRKGESKKRGNQPQRVSQSVLECANDWKLLVDFDAKKAEFPPTILASSLRPDIVLWSSMSRVVVLIELTCCAEEGMGAAKLRKEAKYTVRSITRTFGKRHFSRLRLGPAAYLAYQRTRPSFGLLHVSSGKSFMQKVVFSRG